MKTVVITGSTRGIGRGLAESFVNRGHQVVVTGRNQTAVDAVVSALNETAGQAKAAGFACDICNIGQLEDLWLQACDRFGDIDIWINNAGMSIQRKPLAEQSAADIEAIVSTNLAGLLLANRVALAGMNGQGHGQIWNMEGFGSGGQTSPGMVAYGATKRAVNYINKALQKEVKGSPVQVCTLSPGIVVTELLTGDYDLDSEEWVKARKIFNILGDKVETVTPWLVDRVLATNKSGATVAWLTAGKAFSRFMRAGFSKRDLFS